MDKMDRMAHQEKMVLMAKMVPMDRMAQKVTRVNKAQQEVRCLMVMLITS
jgi:hypothetical protein